MAQHMRTEVLYGLWSQRDLIQILTHWRLEIVSSFNFSFLISEMGRGTYLTGLLWNDISQVKSERMG